MTIGTDRAVVERNPRKITTIARPDRAQPSRDRRARSCVRDDQRALLPCLSCKLF